MSQSENDSGRPRKNNRRNSILRPVQNAFDSEDGGKKEKRRVSFHNTKMIQNFDKEHAGYGLQGDPVRQKINETAGSDGVLSPGRMSHISGTSSNVTATYSEAMDISQMNSTVLNSTVDMFCAPSGAARKNRRQGELKSPRRETSAAFMDNTCTMFSSPTGGMDKPNVTLFGGDMSCTTINMDPEETVMMFETGITAPSDEKPLLRATDLNSSKVQYTLNETDAMFISPAMERNKYLEPNDTSNMDITVGQEADGKPLLHATDLNSSKVQYTLNETDAMFISPAMERNNYSEPNNTSNVGITVGQAADEKPLLHATDLNSSKVQFVLNETDAMFISPAMEQNKYLEPNNTSNVDITVGQEADEKPLLHATDLNSSKVQFALNETDAMFISPAMERDKYLEPNDTSNMDITVGQGAVLLSSDACGSPSKRDTSAPGLRQVSTSFSPSSADNLSKNERREASVVKSLSEPKDVSNRDISAGQETIVLSSDMCSSPVKRYNDTLCLSSDRISRSFLPSTDGTRSENERRDMSMVSHISLLNHSGLGELKTIYGKDSSIPTDSLNVSVMSNRGKLRRRSNLVAHLDTSIRSEPRDVTKKNFDLNTSINSGDTNSHSAETLMRIQRLLQFDPRSVSVAVVEPVSSQKFANIARKMMTEDLQTVVSSSLNNNKEIVRHEISKVTTASRNSALTILKFSDLDVVDRDMALACRRTAEASWWNARNKVVSSHLERAISSNLKLEQQLENLDHDLYLVENSSPILRETSALKNEVADADYLFNAVDPEEIDQLLAAEQKSHDETPSLKLPQLHRGILEDCGIDVTEYEEASLGEDDVAFLQKLNVINALIPEQNKINKDLKKLENGCREWELFVRRRQERKEQRRRDLDSMLVQMEKKLTALGADYSDVLM